MARVGYARAGSEGLGLAAQLEKLKHCDKVFEEKASGGSSQRPSLQACLEYLGEGDTLVVTMLNRLARSTLHLCEIAQLLKQKQVHLQVLDGNIDTSSGIGQDFLDMLGTLEPFEIQIRAERQREGIRQAKERGVQFGLGKRLNSQQIAELQEKHEKGITIQALMEDYGLSRASIYRYLRERPSSPD